MEDPTRTPEPIIHRKHVKEFHPTCNKKMEDRAIQYGYNERYSYIIGYSQELVLDRHKAVAFDTNKTRRAMIKPTEKGTYK